ncbi:hypothetical protein P3675_24755, partial [Vibrio parahaemolyticus]|nr:hypothetical protein [Vibrio parahaemolyticus]MDF4564912.1 hypothetical protein [Vibrio parahaemolyticus]MDF5382560.1 hypothetical protein [Vibrio parahaemolyticus]MDG2938030.1 hypothetical protein [Vibrio parahaemolyticus]
GSKLHDYRISLFLCSEVSHFVLESKTHNKAFKSDSQRLAFFIPTLGFVFTVVWLGSVVALLTP